VQDGFQWAHVLHYPELGFNKWAFGIAVLLPAQKGVIAVAQGNPRSRSARSRLTSPSTAPDAEPMTPPASNPSTPSLDPPQTASTNKRSPRGPYSPPSPLCRVSQLYLSSLLCRPRLATRTGLSGCGQRSPYHYCARSTLAPGATPIAALCENCGFRRPFLSTTSSLWLGVAWELIIIGSVSIRDSCTHGRGRHETVYRLVASSVAAFSQTV
jgi:hypothetical protein